MVVGWGIAYTTYMSFDSERPLKLTRGDQQICTGYQYPISTQNMNFEAVCDLPKNFIKVNFQMPNSAVYGDA